MIVAQKNDESVMKSKEIYVSTAGDRAKSNPVGIKIKKKVIVKAKKLKIGRTLSLKATIKIKKKSKVQTLASMRYETSNKKIATVTSKGLVKGLKQGKCFAYVYAQNGICKKIKIVVK